MSEPKSESASPKDPPSQGAAVEDVKMEDAPEDTAAEDAAAKHTNLEEDLFASDSDEDFPGPKGPDTPTSSNDDLNPQPIS